MEKVKLAEGSHFINSYTNGPVWINRQSAVVRSEIGMYCTVGVASFVADSKIGNYCSIASRVTCGAYSHPIDLFSTHEISFKATDQFFGESLLSEDLKLDRPVTKLGNDVYVGDNAVILSGRSVATGTVVGAGAVVTKDTEPYSVVVGNPARIIKYRFGKNKREYLLSTEWWNLSISELKKLNLDEKLKYIID